MSTNPFPGLRPFDFEESALFFGRDGQSEELVVRLARKRFLAVVGASGSGKSSLVRAGLLPALLGGFMTRAGSDWRIAILRPGHDPIGNLARALQDAGALGSTGQDAAVQVALAEASLRRGGLGLVSAVRQAGIRPAQPVLIIVDQFEEIFRFVRASAGVDYQNDAAAFVKLILEASRSCDVAIYIVLTMRSDFLGECSLFWELPESVNDCQYLIPRLTRDQLREAIAGPVAVGGAKITPRLVSRLLNDAGDDPDQLPILQHALMRTWDEHRRTGDDHEALDLPHYETIGGMAQALSLHADEAFAELSDDRSREVAERLFKRLTEKGPDNREIRRPATLTEICASIGSTASEVITVIDTFRRPGRSFLMPPIAAPLEAESVIDISHESLIRGWKRLRIWVQEEAESARMYRRLAETASLHQHERAALWRDPDLQMALDWRERNRPSTEWASRYAPGFEIAMAFLNASEQQRAAEITRSERATVRLRLITAAALIFACLALAAAWVALSAYRRAVASRQLADSERIIAEDSKKLAEQKTAEAVSASELASRQKQLAEQKTAEAVSASELASRQKQLAETNAKTALSGQLAAQSDQLRAGPPRYFMQSLLLAIEAYRRFPARESDSALRASLALAPVPGQRLGPQGLVDAVAFSPDEKYVFTGSRDKTLRVFERASGRELARLVQPWGVNALALNADGSLVVSASGDPPHDVDKDGIISQSEPTAGEMRVWDWRTGKELARLPFEAPVERVTFVGSLDMVAASDSKSLKTATFDRKGGGFDTRTIIATGKESWISSFSSDGTLVAVRRPKDAEILKLADASVTGHIPITDSEVRIVLSPDNKRVAVTGQYGDTRIFDWPSGKLIATRGGSTEAVFSPDGELLAQIDGNNNTVVTSTKSSGEPVGVMESGRWLSGTVIDLAEFLPNSTLKFQPYSTALATALDDGAVRVWRPRQKGYGIGASFEELFRMGEDKITSINVSRDGRFVVAGDESGARVWELASGHEVKRWLGASRFAFGRRYAATGTGKEIQLIDIQTDMPVATTSGSFSDFLFSPDQSILVIATPDSLEFRHVPELDLMRRVPVGSNIRGMEFTADGKSVIVASEAGTIVEIGTDGKRADRVKKSDQSDPVISPHGRYFIQSSASHINGSVPARLLHVYERSGREVAALEGQSFDSHLIFAPNEEFFVSHVDEMTLGVWRSATGELLFRIPISDHFGSFAISPDSKYVAVEAGPRIALWDVAARKTARFFDHFSRVGHLAFSADSRWFLADCETLRVWSMDTGELWGAIEGVDYDDRSSFTPDGKYIVSQLDLRTGGATPYLSFTLFRPEDLIAEGCRRATRNLTDDEWQQHLRSQPRTRTCPNLP
jgi:WD40 repeat protein